MTDDEREARIIISRWITKVTGVSPVERGLRKIGTNFRKIAEAIEGAADPMRGITSKLDDEYGVVG